VRISFLLDDYRANQPTSDTTVYSPAFANDGLVTTQDLDKDGATASDGDYEDAYLEATALYDLTTGEAKLVAIQDVMLQRYRFNAVVRGRIRDGADIYLDNMAITMTTADGKEYIAFSESQTSGDTITAGVFDLGTIEWFIDDVSDPTLGEIGYTISVEGATVDVGSSGTLLPDARRNLTLVVTVL